MLDLACRNPSVIPQGGITLFLPRLLKRLLRWFLLDTVLGSFAASFLIWFFAGVVFHAMQASFFTIMRITYLLIACVGVIIVLARFDYWKEAKEAELEAMRRRSTGPDPRPKGEDGDYFEPGVPITGYVDRCFVCGDRDQKGCLMVGTTKTALAAARIQTLFDGGAAYLQPKPETHGVRIGACLAHRPNLQHLTETTKSGVITPRIIKEAQGF